MKTNSAQKSTPRKNAPAPEASPAEFLAKMNNKTDREMLAATWPTFAEHLAAGNNEALARVAGLLWGTGLDLGVPLPDWVKSASKLFWESTGMDFLPVQAHGKRRKLGDLPPYALGQFMGLMEMVFQISSPKTKAERAGANLAQILRIDAANFPPKESKQFFDGRASASKLIAKMQGPPQRAKVFLIIAIAWRQIERMQSVRQLHDWLLDNGLIVSATDSRETRKVCEMVGLEFQNKWRKPKV